MDEKVAEKAPETNRVGPSMAEAEILDGEAVIATPPPRPSGTIRVRLQAGGRSRPIAADVNKA